jgi:protein phosphatase
MKIQDKQWEVYKISEKGNFREINEDYIGYNFHNESNLLVVADGMGGHNAGEIASKIAVETIMRHIEQLKEPNVEEELINAVKIANTEIYSKSKQSLDYAGMGTTITASLILNDYIYIANVGDSRCYIVKKNEIMLITKDHSLVQELVDSGAITEEEAKIHPSKNIITRALGTSKDIEVDIYKIESYDITDILLCTDGASNVLSNEELLNIIKNNDVSEVCNNIFSKSLEMGSRDNISVILCRGDS